VFELSWTHNQVALQQLDITVTEVSYVTNQGELKACATVLKRL